MLNGLRTVVYPATDLTTSKQFYTELLGFPPYFDEWFYVGFQVGGYELGLVPDGAPGVTGGVAYWAVDDVPAAIARATSLGAGPLDSPQDVGGGIVTGAVTDPSGNRFGLIFNPHFAAEIGAQVAASGAETSARVIVSERTVEATPEQVWALWTSSEGLARWLVPNANVALRVGGPYEFFFDMDQAPGKRGGEGNRVLTFLAPRLLTFTWNAPPHLKTRDARTVVVLELTEASAGTRVRLTHTGWPAAGLADESTDWEATYVYFERAWSMVMQALAAHFATAPTV